MNQARFIRRVCDSTRGVAGFLLRGSIFVYRAGLQTIGKLPRRWVLEVWTPVRFGYIAPGNKYFDFPTCILNQKYHELTEVKKTELNERSVYVDVESVII